MKEIKTPLRKLLSFIVPCGNNLPIKEFLINLLSAINANKINNITYIGMEKIALQRNEKINFIIKDSGVYPLYPKGRRA